MHVGIVTVVAAVSLGPVLPMCEPGLSRRRLAVLSATGIPHEAWIRALVEGEWLFQPFQWRFAFKHKRRTHELSNGMIVRTPSVDG